MVDSLVTCGWVIIITRATKATDTLKVPEGEVADEEPPSHGTSVSPSEQGNNDTLCQSSHTQAHCSLLVD